MFVLILVVVLAGFYIFSWLWNRSQLSETFLLDLIDVLLVPKHIVVFGYWHFYLFEDIVDDSSVPQELLLVQIIDQVRFMLLDVPPSHQIRKSF